jgi:hypothetical protein
MVKWPLCIIKQCAMNMYGRVTMGGGGLSALYHNHFTLRKGTCITCWIGGWLGARVSLAMVVKRKVFCHTANQTLLVQLIPISITCCE